MLKYFMGKCCQNQFVKLQSLGYRTIVPGLIYYRCPIFFYSTSHLTNRAASEVYQTLGPIGVAQKITQDIWLIHPLIFLRGEKSAKFSVDFRPQLHLSRRRRFEPNNISEIDDVADPSVHCLYLI